MHRQDAVPNPQTRISTPLHAEAWPQQFGEKVVWMAKNDQQTAQININPPQLGPVQITLSLSGDQATAVFASPHAEVRQAIESSLPNCVKCCHRPASIWGCQRRCQSGTTEPEQRLPDAEQSPIQP
jgi:hypothetical protein